MESGPGKRKRGRERQELLWDNCASFLGGPRRSLRILSHSKDRVKFAPYKILWLCVKDGQEVDKNGSRGMS